MDSLKIDKFLIDNDIKPTPNRILVLRQLMSASHPVSLADIEAALDTMDKASIFRVLELLAEKEIVHLIEDGSRSLKYELCTNLGHHDIHDHHVHFYCERCKETFCFKEVHVPVIEMPEGFRAHAVNYMLKGICPKCAKL